MKFIKIATIFLRLVIIAAIFFIADTALAQSVNPLISGHVRHSDGTGMKGVVLDGLPGSPETDSNGFYSITVDVGWSGTATPEIPLHNFDPPSRTYNNITTDLPDQDYTGSLFTFTISGHILTSDGAALEGVAVEGGPEGTVITDSNGFYSITVEVGWSGIVKPETAGYTFVPSDCTYTDVTEDGPGQNYMAIQIPGIDCGSPTIRSDRSGDWNDPNTWAPARVPGWNDIVQINFGDTVVINSSAEIRTESICNSGILTSTPGAEIKITASDFIYNGGKIRGGDGADGAPGTSVILTGKRTFFNAQSGDIQGGRGGNHYGWTARGGDGGSVEIYGDTITNKGIIGPECYSDSPGTGGGNGGNASTPHGSGTTCGGSYGGNGGNAILLADTLLINTSSARISTGTGGDANYGHCSPYPGKGGNIVFSAPVAIQNGTIMGCGQGGTFSWDPTIAMTGSKARWHSENIKIYGGENWTLDLRNLNAGAMSAISEITLAVGPGSVLDFRGVAKGALQAAKVDIFADTILLDEGVTLSEIISTPHLVVSPPKILYDFMIKVPRQILIGETEEIVFFDLFVLNNSPVEDTYTVKVTDSKGYELNVHSYQTFKVKALSKTELSLNVMLPSAVGASETLHLTVTSSGDPELVKGADIKIISSQASEDELQDSDNDGISDAKEAEYETDHNNPDTDGDGMKDGWEIAHNLDPLTDDAWADPDEDGYANIEEYEAGADPGKSDLIDFESVPKTLPSEGLEIGDQFQLTHGVLFRLDTDKDGFPDADAFPVLGKTGGEDSDRDFDSDDTVSRRYASLPGDFFLTTDASDFSLIIIYDSPVSAASAHIWDIDGSCDSVAGQWLAEAMGEAYRSGEDDVIDVMSSPPGTDDLSSDEKFHTWSFEHETPDIHAIRISFSGSASGIAFDNFAPSSLPPRPRFEGGVFTVGDNGVVVIDWLYDGGAYQGELGIFSLAGMELLPMKAFVGEAAKRALSDTETGYVILSDRKEGARYRGFLGEKCERNGGRYKGVKRFNMFPRDRFATILIPNGTLQEFYDNMETDVPEKRPLFSLISANSDYGMHIGQMADVNGLGNAFVYEDVDLNDSENDYDYNDFIIQITGVTTEGVPGLDSLVSAEKEGRRKRDDRGWFDWRTETDLGRLIVEHIETPVQDSEEQWVSLTLDASSALLLYDAQDRECSTAGCNIPGISPEFGDDGSQAISLPLLETGDYRLVIRGATDETGHLSVRKYSGKNSTLSEESGTVTLGAHETLVSNMTIYDTGDGFGMDVGQAGESPAGPYDFNGNGVIDDADIEAVSVLWNICDGEQRYEPFYDLDNDGCVTVLDIMQVVNSKEY